MVTWGQVSHTHSCEIGGGLIGRRSTDEILLSSDKTIAVIDGSGVLSDPIGINREELVRLAKLRVPVSHFDKSKLSPDGYLVKVEDQDAKLPCKLQPVRNCATRRISHP
jgi:NAD-specific glutamate dehydrogenase